MLCSFFAVIAEACVLRLVEKKEGDFWKIVPPARLDTQALQKLITMALLKGIQICFSSPVCALQFCK